MPLLGVARLRDTVALISPWMAEGNLRSYIRAHPEARPVELMADVACGLAYLHSLGIVYGNLRSVRLINCWFVWRMGSCFISDNHFGIRHGTRISLKLSVCSC